MHADGCLLQCWHTTTPSRGVMITVIVLDLIADGAALQFMHSMHIWIGSWRRSIQ
jgi:hypothetical protein